MQSAALPGAPVSRLPRLWRSRHRPLGIAALEDKIVQQAVVAILTPIYESEFLGFSYGFRPGRSQHDALDALAFGIKAKKIRWILDADISRFLDASS